MSSVSSSLKTILFVLGLLAVLAVLWLAGGFEGDRELGAAAGAAEHASVAEVLLVNRSASQPAKAASETRGNPVGTLPAVTQSYDAGAVLVDRANVLSESNRPVRPDGVSPTVSWSDAGGAEWVLALRGPGVGPAPPGPPIVEPLLDPMTTASRPFDEDEKAEATGYQAWESPPGRFSQLSVGGYHNCALQQDGSVLCWGDNSDGQTEAPMGTFVQVSAGYSHSCGVRENCSVECWGETEYHEIVSTSGTSVPIEQPDDPFVFVSAGNWTSCGLRPDGGVGCWGLRADNSGGLVELDPKGRFVQISAGGDLCGLRPDGTVLCWGGHNGEWTAPGGPYAQVSVGGWHKCGLRVNGEAVCWLGYDPADPNRMVPIGRFVQLSAGYRHTCGVRDNGAVACWGYDRSGRLDAPEGQFRYVGAGAEHSCALTHDGEVVCWGGKRD